MNAEQRIVAILRSRGLEATPDDVLRFVVRQQGMHARYGLTPPTAEDVANLLEVGDKGMTTSLHVHFGDAL